MDFDCTKVLSAWFGNFGMFAYIHDFDWRVILKDSSGIVQLGVGVVTILYICVKIRNEWHKK